MRPVVVVERPPFLCDFTCFVDSSEKNVIITVQVEESLYCTLLYQRGI